MPMGSMLEATRPAGGPVTASAPATPAATLATSGTVGPGRPVSPAVPSTTPTGAGIDGAFLVCKVIFPARTTGTVTPSTGTTIAEFPVLTTIAPTVTITVTVTRATPTSRRAAAGTFLATPFGATWG